MIDTILFDLDGTLALMDQDQFKMCIRDRPCADPCSARSLVSGCAEGILAGGNLSLVSSSLGTP